TIRIVSNIFLEKNICSLGDWSEYMYLARMFNMELDSNLNKEMHPMNSKIKLGYEISKNKQPITGLNKKQIEDYLNWIGDFITARIKHFKGECSGAYWQVAKEIFEENNFTVVYSLPDSAMLNSAVGNKLVEANKKCPCELTSESINILSEEQIKNCCFRGYAVYVFGNE